MGSMDSNGPDWAYLEALDLLWADREAGGLRNLADYLVRFPGQESALRAAWEQVHDVTSVDRAVSPTGETVGPYRILSELGRGGQAIVYLAEDTRLGRRVALKVLTERLARDDTDQLRRFRREAEVTSRIDHPGIGVVYEADARDGVCYIAMRFVPGRTLSDLVRTSWHDTARERTQHLDPNTTEPTLSTPESTSDAPSSRDAVARILKLIEDTALALQVAHDSGIIHRDIKPGNIMVTPNQRPVILDFGLASVDDPGRTLTHSGDIFGTPSYMAPEQLRGDRCDARTDVWALGVTLFECLTLKKPFVGQSRMALYQAIRSQPPPELRRLNRSLPRDLQVVVQAALEKEPNRRYQTALDLAEDLRALQELRPIRARPPALLRRLVSWMRREPAKALAGILIAVASPVIAGLWTYIAATSPQVAAAKEQARRERIERWLERGYAELGEGPSHAAVGFFRQAVEHAPESVEARYGLVSAYAFAGNRREVEALLPLLSPDGAQARVRLSALETLERREEAAALRARIPEPDEPIALFLAGQEELRRGHRGDVAAFERAVELLHRAVCWAPHARPLYHFEWAHAAGHAQGKEPAIQSSEAVRRLWAESPTGWFRVGFALRLHDPPAAVLAYLKAIELDPKRSTLWFNLGVVYGQQGKTEEGLKAFLEATRWDPSFAQAHGYAGDNLLLLQRPREALVAYDRALALQPDVAETLMMQCSAHRALGDRKAARACLLRAVKLDDGSATIHFNLGTLSAEEGQYEDALREYRRASELDPKSATADVSSGVILFFHLNRQDAGLEALTAACKKHPTSGIAHYQLGRALRHLGKHDEAFLACQQALALDPSRADMLVDIGLYFIHRGRSGEGLGLLRRAVHVAPTDTRAHEQFLTALTQQEDQAGALDEQARWARAHPEVPAPWAELARFLLRRRDAEGGSVSALEAARHAVKLSSRQDPKILLLLARALLREEERVEAQQVLNETDLLLKPPPEDAELRGQIERLRDAL